MKTVQDDSIYAIIAIGMGAVMVALLIFYLLVSDPTRRKLFCWVRGGHQFVPHRVQLARAIRGDQAAYRTDICTRRYCGIQREVPIIKPLQEA
jgi:hypothetical protein